MRYLLPFIFLLAAAPLYAQPGGSSRHQSDGLDFRHMALFTPFSGVVAYGNINPGAGIDYEYIISQEYGVGVHIPFILGYAGPDDGFFYNDYYRHTSIYTAPGIRFHTANSRSNVDFVTGPSVLIGNMHFSPVDDYYNPGIVRNPYDYSMIGLLADNSLNFYRNHFVFGFDVRLGTMIERRESTRFFIHFGMHFGGRF